jgi:thiol:disulfide interchange protein DsbD
VIPGLIVSQNLAELYDTEGSEANLYEEGPWKEWSEESVADALESGHGVFIDFTASWCLICQSNKALVLRKEKTEALFVDYGIRLFVADWTQNDPEITRALEAYERSGVPLYVLKSADGTEKILPQNLSYSVVEAAVEALFSKE